MTRTEGADDAALLQVQTSVACTGGGSGTKHGDGRGRNVHDRGRLELQVNLCELVATPVNSARSLRGRRRAKSRLAQLQLGKVGGKHRVRHGPVGEERGRGARRQMAVNCRHGDGLNRRRSAARAHGEWMEGWLVGEKVKLWI